MTKKLMEQVLDALITYRDFINNAHIIEGQFHWLEGTGDAIKALEEALKQEQDDSVSYIKEVIEALYENSDPVSVEAGELLERIVANQEQHEPVAMRYDFDGYGYKYIDSGSGSDWQTRERGAEPLYTHPQPKQEQGEPVAYGFPNSAITSNQKWMLLEEKIPENDQYKGALWIPLYTTPQTKEWVKLTEKQIDEIYYKSDLNIDDQYNQMYEFVKAIELAHGIKE